MLVVIDQKHIDGKGWGMLDADDRDETLTLDVLAYLKKTFPVDASRVYLWGISAGGKLSQVLAAKHSDLFAAVVSFSGVFDDPEEPALDGLLRLHQELAAQVPDPALADSRRLRQPDRVYAGHAQAISRQRAPRGVRLAGQHAQQEAEARVVRRPV